MQAPVVAPVQQPRGVRGLVARLHERFAHLISEVGKFGIVGIVCYGIDTLIFNLCYALPGQPITAKIISTTIAATAAFIGNRQWTWRHRERTSLKREYTLYFAFNTIGLGIGLACLAVSHYWLGSMWPSVFATQLADNISANVIGMGIATLFRFWAYRRFVFRAGAPTV